MNRLKHIKMLPIEIGLKLSDNILIQKLLLNDSPDALNVSIEKKNFNDLVKDEKIVFHQIISDGINNNNNNTFISIYLDSITNDENQLYNNIVVYAVTDSDHFLLENNKFRLLELSEQIINSLDGVKCSIAGELNFNSMDYLNFESFVFGYVLRFSATEEIRKVEL